MFTTRELATSQLETSEDIRGSYILKVKRIKPRWFLSQYPEPSHRCRYSTQRTYVSELSTEKVHPRSSFHRVPQGCGLFPYCAAVGSVIF